MMSIRRFADLCSILLLFLLTSSALADLPDAGPFGPTFVRPSTGKPFAGPAADAASAKFSFASSGYRSIHFDFSSNVGTQPFQVTTDGDMLYVSLVGNNVVRQYQIVGSNLSFIRDIGAPGAGAGQFNGPEQVAVVGNDLFVADFSNHRIQRFNRTTGAYISQFGSAGPGLGQLNSPSGLIFNPANGLLYVSEIGNDRIQMFSTAGVSQGSFGSSGSGNGQLENPYVLAIDSSGNLYAADSSNDRVVKFTSNGTFVRNIANGISTPLGLAVDAADHVWITSVGDLYEYDNTGNYLAYYYGSGAANAFDGYFQSLRGIAVQRTSTAFPFNGRPAIVVADLSAGNVQVFTSSVQPTVHPAGGSLTGLGTFQGQIAVDPQGNAFVTSLAGNRIYKFNRQGTLLTSWGTSGTGNGQFSGAYGVTVDDSGNVYVVDHGNERIQKFDNNGSYLLQWGSLGVGNGQFNGPSMIATDGTWIYVSDEGNDRIQKFNLTGTYVRQWGGSGIGNGQLDGPTGITIDRQRNQVYVAEFQNSRIQQFSAFGDFIRVFTDSQSGIGALLQPRGLATDGRGNVYCADGGHMRVVQFNDQGTYLANFSTASTPNGIGLDRNINRLYLGSTAGTMVATYGSTTGYSDGIGVYRPSLQAFLVRHAITAGPATITASVTGATSGDQPLTGDWDGDAIDTPGLFRPATATFYLWDRWSNLSIANAAYVFSFGGSGNSAFVIDWNSDGKDDVGIHETASNTDYVRDVFTGGVAVFSYQFGNPSDIRFGGDWDGDGAATPGVYTPSVSLFTFGSILASGTLTASGTQTLGAANSRPLIGDWAHAGFKQVGTFVPATATMTLAGDGSNTTVVYAPFGPGVLFKDGFESGFPDSAGDIPLGGNWGTAPE